MIKILGIKRVVAIAILIAIGSFMGAVLFGIVLPELQKTERDLRVARASVAASRTELDQLRNDFEFFKNQKYLFEDLKQIGFFSNQDRYDAQKRIEAIQDQTNILHMHYNIPPASVEENENAAKAEYVVLKTSATVDVDAMDDLDFYSFMYWIDNAFTGQVSITGFDMERVLDVNSKTLRHIGSGAAATLLKGSMSFEWRTLIPRADYVEEGGAPR